MKVAIYARYSSDKQSEASIDDQVRNCTRYAENKEGWKITSRFEDKAITGSVRARPGYNAMQEAAKKKEFDVLLVDDLSRISRDELEMKYLIRQFQSWGLRIVCASDGYDSSAKGEKIQATMRGLMNEIYLDDLRDKTHRGLVGRVLKKMSAGGKAYGYKRVPIENPSKLDPNGRPTIDGVRWKINEEQAKIVVMMFEWYASGKSPRSIAGELNRLGVPSPRSSTWAANCIYGDAERGTGLLNNPLYNGRYVWNRSKSTKNPDTGKRKYFNRPKTEWIEVDVPELRIISPELWDKVKARQQEIRERTGNLREALNNPNAKAKAGKYVFSGLLKCGCCGANYTMYSTASYACATNINRGDAACPNRLRVPRKIVEECLLECIYDDLYSDEGIDLFVKDLEAAIQQKLTAAKPDNDAIKRDMENTERKIANLVKAVEDGDYNPAIKAALDKAVAEKARLETSLAPQTSVLAGICTLLPDAKARYKALTDNLAATLTRNVPQAREYLKTLIGSVKLIPQPEGYLIAELQQNPAGLVALAGMEKLKFDLVAGAGFEPTTFRL